MFLKIFPFDVTGTRTMTHDDNVVMCGSQSEKSDVRVQENVIGSFRVSGWGNTHGNPTNSDAENLHLR